MKMLRRVIAIWSIGVVVGLANLAQAGLQTILDKDHQGQGNKGLVFRPVDVMGNASFFELTARSLTDHTVPFNPDAAGQAGTVYIDKNGAGVQSPSASGSKGISGGGGHKDEELVFTFDAAIPASSIILELIDIGFNDDDPVIFLSVAGSGAYGLTVLEAEIQGAFTPTGGKEGLVDFSMLGSLPAGLLIDSFKIRETDGHIEVSGITNAVPEPAAVAMFGLGVTAMAWRRRPRCS